MKRKWIKVMIIILINEIEIDENLKIEEIVELIHYGLNMLPNELPPSFYFKYIEQQNMNLQGFELNEHLYKQIKALSDLYNNDLKQETQIKNTKIEKVIKY